MTTVPSRGGGQGTVCPVVHADVFGYGIKDGGMGHDR